MTDVATNVAILRDAYWRWHDTKGGSADHWAGLFGDEVEFRSLGGGAPEMPFTATCKSRAALKRYFKGLAQDWAMNHYHIHEYVAEDDFVVAIGECSFRHKRTGKTLVTPKVDIWRFRDGKAVSFMEMFDTAAGFAATRGAAAKAAAKPAPKSAKARAPAPKKKAAAKSSKKAAKAKKR